MKKNRRLLKILAHRKSWLMCLTLNLKHKKTRAEHHPLCYKPFECILCSAQKYFVLSKGMQGKFYALKISPGEGGPWNILGSRSLGKIVQTSREDLEMG